MSELMSVYFNPNRCDFYAVADTEDANPIAQTPVVVDEAGGSSKKSSASAWDTLQGWGNAVAVRFNAGDRVGFSACTAISRRYLDNEPVDGGVGPDATDAGDTGVCVDNQAPGEFGTTQPANNATGVSLRPTFQWSESVDPDGHAVNYTLMIDTDENFSNPVTYDASGLTEYTLADPLARETTYYWRVGARDICDELTISMPTPAFRFTTLADCTTDPGTFDLVDPADQSNNVSITPTLDWSDSLDIDPGDSVTYRLEISTDAAFTAPIVYNGLTDSTYTLNIAEALANGTIYYWRVTAVDDCQNEVASTSTFSFTTVEYCAQPPAVFDLLTPVNAATDISITPTFDWEDSIDADAGDSVAYRLEIDTINTFPAPTIFNGITGSTYTITPGDALGYNQTYYWRVTAIDDCNNEVASTGVFNFTTEMNCMTFSETDNWAGVQNGLDDATITGSLILGPFITSGDYSIVIDAGTFNVNWNTLTYNANIPDPGNSSLTIETRSSSDCSNWPPTWDPLGGGGSIDSTDERCLEVRFNFLINNTSIPSPELQDYTANYCIF